MLTCAQWVGRNDESRAINAGDDVTGIIEAVGSEVYEYKAGDRVAAFHRMGTPHGTYAEYAIAPASTTFHLPPNISFEAGAGLPLSFMTAALAWHQQLRLPFPTVPGEKDIPVLNLRRLFPARSGCVRAAAGEVEQAQSHHHCRRLRRRLRQVAERRHSYHRLPQGQRRDGHSWPRWGARS